MQAITKTAQFARLWPLIGLAAVLQLPACGAAETDVPEASEATPADSATHCEHGNALLGELEGSDFGLSFQWEYQIMDCDSMLRPNRDGPRLRFSGPYLGPGDDSDEARMAFIFALPGLEAGESGIEVPTNITIQIEGTGRFFSTPNMQSCWAEIKANEPVDGIPDLYQLGGVVFCIAPLGELNSNDFVEITELAFTATVDWSES